MNDMNNMNNKYKYVFLYHALGDTIGFKNSLSFAEYTNKTLDTINEMIYEFIDLGGINGLDMKDWIVSEDTLYHIAMARSLLKYKEMNEKFIFIVKENLIKIHNEMINEEEKNGIYRYPELISDEYIQQFKDADDGRTFKYDPKSGTSGACARNLCIGLLFHDEKNEHELIEVAITTSKLTHNSAFGYLAGLTSALFVSWAIREIHINKWPFKLLELLESDEIKKFINEDNDKHVNYTEYISYIKYWKKYIDTKFVDTKPIKTRSFGNPLFRMRYYFSNFVKDTKDIFNLAGKSGFSAIIVAYDALLDCDGKFEKLIIYSILHPSVCDTIGAIACGLYGAVYNMGDVPEYMLEHLEKKNILLELADNIKKIS